MRKGPKATMVYELIFWIGIAALFFMFILPAPVSWEVKLLAIAVLWLLFRELFREEIAECRKLDEKYSAGPTRYDQIRRIAVHHKDESEKRHKEI